MWVVLVGRRSTKDKRENGPDRERKIERRLTVVLFPSQLTVVTVALARRTLWLKVPRDLWRVNT